MNLSPSMRVFLAVAGLLFLVMVIWQFVGFLFVVEVSAIWQLDSPNGTIVARAESVQVDKIVTTTLDLPFYIISSMRDQLIITAKDTYYDIINIGSIIYINTPLLQKSDSFVLSDKRETSNVTALDHTVAGEKVMSLLPRKYELLSSPNKTHFGFFADELNSTLEDSTTESDNGMLYAKQTEVVPLLVSTLQKTLRMLARVNLRLECTDNNTMTHALCSCETDGCICSELQLLCNNTMNWNICNEDDPTKWFCSIRND